MRFGTKLALLFWVCTIGISTVTVGLFYRESAQAIRKEAGTRLADSALNASSLVDPAALSQIRNKGGESTPEFKALAARLTRVLDANERIRRVYILVPSLKQNTLTYVADVQRGSASHAKTGTPWSVPAGSKVMLGFACAVFDNETRTDSWGTWLSGYAPVKTNKGKAIALIGIDMSATEILGAQRKIQTSSLLSMLAALALATALSFLLSSMVSRSIVQLTQATQQIADGNLDCPITINSRDELGVLATSLNHMVENIKENQASLMKQANTDGLTGLYNHRYFQERLNQELKRAVRYSRPVSLVMIDLDGFKAVNDNLGHPAGDSILRNFAEILSQEIREIDVAARYGGDEFAVVLPETGCEEAMRTAERIREAVERHPAMASQPSDDQQCQPHTVWKVTVSIGVAECPTHARHRDPLISAADIAMYHAKNVSQNAVASYSQVPGAGTSMDPCRVYSFLQNASVNTIAALAEAVDAKDHYTHGHSESVARYAVGIATELRLNEEDKFHIRIAAMLHDVGKIGVPDMILNNPSELTEHEREIIRTHPMVGEHIVKQVPQLRKILPGILYHHERFDGMGYPCGLRAERIPLAARIICVADAFDAMTSNRPYREAMTMGQAMHELMIHRGTQFDPMCVDALVRWIQAEQIQAA